MTFEDLLEAVGEFGIYQRFLIIVLYVPVLFAGIQALAYVFLCAVPSHRCFVRNCDNSDTSYVEDFVNWTVPIDDRTDSFSSCVTYALANDDLTNNSATNCSRNNFVSNATDACYDWKFDNSTYLSTTVTQWNLVCDRASLIAASQSSHMFGIMIGAIVFGWFADRFGRRNAIVASILIAAITSTAIPFASSYSLFLILKVIVGAGCQGIYQTIFVMSVELVGSSMRAFCGLLIAIYFSIGEIALGIVAFYIRDWRALQLYVSLPMLVFIAYYWIIPESPRWLMSKQRFSSAKKILENIAKRNSRTVPYDLLNIWHSDILSKNVVNADNVLDVHHHSIVDLFRTRRLRWRTINIVFNWFMNTIAYYGISMTTPTLGGNEFINFIVISAVEIPAYVFAMLVLDRAGRRLPLCMCMIVGGVAGIATTFVPTNKRYLWISISLALVAKFGAAAAFGIIYVFTAELFPTVVRNNGIGLSSMLGHVGGVIAPYIGTLSTYGPALPLTIYGFFSLVAGLTAVTLPETLNKQLPDSIQDAEEFSRKLPSNSRTVVQSNTSETHKLLSRSEDE